MLDYLKLSYKKFKSDALSKVFYDVIKFIVIGLVGLMITTTLPIELIKIFLDNSLEISVFQALLFGLLLILATVLSVSIFYQKRYRKFKEQNQIDELTGLKNHKALEEYIKERLQYYKKNDGALSIILIDIDDFKSFNSRYGYNTADLILGKVGELLRSDRRATDETFRKFSRGDEFLIITNDTSLSNAILAADRKRILIEKNSFIVQNTSYKLTVSCGVTQLKPYEDDYITLTDRANMALLEAKKTNGKNSTKSNT